MRTVVIVGLAVVEDGRMALVRKTGLAELILPGGKIEPGETEMEALGRELAEELGCGMEGVHAIGTFTDRAAGTTDVMVEVRLHGGRFAGIPAPRAEIEELVWTDMREPGHPVAPSLRNLIFPAMLDAADQA